MSIRIFKRGDVVYHVKFGKGTIRTVGNANEYCIFFGDGTRWHSDEALLSFIPWPEPSHRRPFEPGWYLVETTGRSFGHNVMYFAQTKGIKEFFDVHFYKPLHYFGDTLPNNLKEKE